MKLLFSTIVLASGAAMAGGRHASRDGGHVLPAAVSEWERGGLWTRAMPEARSTGRSISNDVKTSARKGYSA